MSPLSLKLCYFKPHITSTKDQQPPKYIVLLKPYLSRSLHIKQHVHPSCGTILGLQMFILQACRRPLRCKRPAWPCDSGEDGTRGLCLRAAPPKPHSPGNTSEPSTSIGLRLLEWRLETTLSVKGISSHHSAYN